MSETVITPAAPTRLGHYQLETVIGRGGMGIVYRARDTRLDRDVAIKCLRAELYEPDYRARFKREALLLARLNHPGIVHVYDYLESDEQLALVMEYVNGQNLQIWLREHLVPLSVRLQWLADIADGLSVAHDAGIIHRDLKAENILVNQHQQVKISDFGIARSADNQMTLHDAVSGSYCSMSPEQAMGEALDFRSDLFSLGILAYQLLCGTHPFGRTENKLQIMQRIISHAPIPPQQSNPDLPPALAQLLLQLLSKDPAKRPNDARTVARDFEAFSRTVNPEQPVQDTTLLITPPAGKPEPATTVVAQTKSVHNLRRRFAVIGSAALVIALSAFGFYQNRAVVEPTYIAIVPPVLDTTTINAAQQDMILGAIYSAMQQSAVQLKNVYVTPAAQMEEISGDFASIRTATGADELLTADVNCQRDICRVQLSRLISGPGSQDARLHVADTRMIEVLNDQYLTMANLVQSTIGNIYRQRIVNEFDGVPASTYQQFIDTTRAFRRDGGTRDQLQSLDAVGSAIQRVPSLRNLYTQIAMDLYYETSDDSYLNKARQLYPVNALISNDTDYLYGLFGIQLADGDFDAAEQTLARLKKLKISQVQLYELQAELFHYKNDFPEAIASYQRLVRLKPSANGFFNLGIANWYAGNYSAALVAIDDAIDLSPGFFKAWRLKGAIALLSGDADDAITAFQSILDQNPDDESILSNLGVGYLLKHNYADAIEMFSRASALSPGNSTTLLNLADAFSLAGERVQAEDFYNRLLQQQEDVGNRDYLRNRIQSLAHLGQYSEAIQALQKLQRDDPHNVDTHYTSALVYTLAGDFNSALVNVENALRANLNYSWFSFAWFDELCRSDVFSKLLQTAGDSARCVASR